MNVIKKNGPGVSISDGGALLFVVLVTVFFLYPPSYSLYTAWYAAAPALLSFVKFALLATFGEMIVARLNAGKYLPVGFGLLPKAVVWGGLGVTIWVAFGIFSQGVPATFFATVSQPGLGMRVAIAFTISFWMNIFFAPIMMLAHHVTDRYVDANGGRFPVRTFALRPLLEEIDWDRMWGFVFRKTIPLFWIPAHTITFLLPEEIRTLFAVMLSVVLGFLLTLGRRGTDNSVT